MCRNLSLRERAEVLDNRRRNLCPIEYPPYNVLDIALFDKISLFVYTSVAIETGQKLGHIMSQGNVVDLWVRAGSDGVRNGGCPVSQQIFMILLLKAEYTQGSLNFNVKTTNAHKPHEEFKSLGLRHLPALVNDDVQLDQFDDIIEYLDDRFPETKLSYKNDDAEQATKDVFSKFCFYIKDVNKDPKHLEFELKKLDGYLCQTNTTFLCGEKMCHLDCQTLPKLHHIRLACGYLKSYEIPSDLPGFWRYMKSAYESPVFKRACPSDQEIVLHWADRPDTKNLTSLQHKELSKQEPTFSFQLPPDVRL